MPTAHKRGAAACAGTGCGPPRAPAADRRGHRLRTAGGTGCGPPGPGCRCAGLRAGVPHPPGRVRPESRL